MQKTQLGVGSGALLLGIFAVFEALRLGYWEEEGPGAGFLAFWAALILAIAVAAWLLREYRTPRKPAAPMEAAAGGRRKTLIKLATVLTAVSIFPLVGEWIGFPLAMVIALIILVAGVERRGIWRSVLFALITVLASYYLLTQTLGVYLPPTPFLP